MDSGVVPHFDRLLLLFERRLAQRIAATSVRPSPRPATLRSSTYSSWSPLVG
ncbi:hypothetical protein [Streptomyces sp. NPDC046859]|uniref:hypothetical protein n=1 Tax=Streptomyces sp. NPDC046859 TaxID=3155734 RepID=UPI0033E13C6D